MAKTSILIKFSFDKKTGKKLREKIEELDDVLKGISGIVGKVDIDVKINPDKP